MAFFAMHCFSLRKNQLPNQNESATTCSSSPITLQPKPLAIGVVSKNHTAINLDSAISPDEDIHQAKTTDKKEIIRTEVCLSRRTTITWRTVGMVIITADPKIT